jgi:hypothetical protein
MKVFYIALRFLLFSLVIFLIDLNSGCKNPDEYAPPQDSLVAPPAPPQLIVPADSELFSQTPGIAMDIYFEWSAVTDAQYYQIQVALDVAFNNTLFDENVYARSVTLTFYQTGEFFWRVRAYSPLWTWYTSWSEIRYFWSTAAKNRVQ